MCRTPRCALESGLSNYISCPDVILQTPQHPGQEQGQEPPPVTTSGLCSPPPLGRSQARQAHTCPELAAWGNVFLGLNAQ